MPRWPWSRKRQHVDPGGPHAFRPTDDGGLSSLASSQTGARGGGTFIGQATLAANFQRDQAHCGVPGCGRERTDSIHDANRRP